MPSLFALKPSFDGTCAIPRTGRTLHNFLNKLKILGADSEEIEKICEDHVKSQIKLIVNAVILIGGNFYIFLHYSYYSVIRCFGCESPHAVGSGVKKDTKVFEKSLKTFLSF